MPATDIKTPTDQKRDLLISTTSGLSTQVERLLDPLPASVYLSAQHGTDFIHELPTPDISPLELLLPVAAHIEGGAEATQCLIISQDEQRIRGVITLAREASAHESLNNIWRELGLVGLYGKSATRTQSEQLTERPDIVVATPERLIDFVRRDSIELSGIRLVVLEEPELEHAEGFNADVQFIYSKLRSTPLTCVLTPSFHRQLSEIERVLSRPKRIAAVDSRPGHGTGDDGERNSSRSNHSQQERSVMPKHTQIEENELKSQVDEILRKILEEEDPEELNAYKRFVKKHVPFSRRGYFMAYLLKHAGGEKPKNHQAGSNGEYTSIFVGVGKNRKVFPKDLIQLFSDVDGVTSEDIGQIKILDNYSFLEITPIKAQPAIDTLNGREFRGRRLTVNFARKKD